ncbi:WD repeat-containing protein wrap73 [Borealophlyctis nickersoniae]|nr:WD repeat-containing protein wrap73 [Borealophlyctis nickersoniae]
MDFTELYKQSHSLCKFSPNGLYLATAVQFRVVIRDSETLQILHLFTCTDHVQQVAWAPDSDLVLCASFKLGLIQVFSLRDEGWTAKIDEGVAGCTAVEWTPDARHLLSFSDFQLRITVWSLTTKDAYYIQYPKFSDRGYSFRKDGKYFALAERKDCKDYISIYDCEDWVLLKRFAVETTDLEDIAWSPDGRFIAAWESLLEYKVLIYYPDGRLVSTYSAYDSGLGIKSVTWSPSSQFLAIGSYDQKVRFLNYYTWKPLIDFSHPQNVPYPDIAIFKETNLRDVKDSTGLASWSQAAAARSRVRYEVLRPPVTVPIRRPDPDKPNPKLGVGLCEFNCNGRFVVTRNDNMPTALWIWDLVELRQVALILQANPVRFVRWNPVKPDRLAFCSGNGYIYVWGGEKGGCECVEVPAVNFQVHNFSWNPDGKSIVLMDKDKFCLAFPIEEATEPSRASGEYQEEGEDIHNRHDEN